MRQVLEGVGGILKGRLQPPVSEYLVEDGEVVGWTCGALERGVGLEVEVPIANFRDAAVDDGAVLRIGRAVGIFFLCG